MIFINLGKNALITWDESIYAMISKNMIFSKEYMTLYWDKIWFEKPPLYFWITAFFMNTFGVTELSARLLSAISGLSIIITTIFFTKRLFGKTSAYLSGFILLTTTQFLYYTRTSMLDVTASFFMTLALVLYYLSSKRVYHLVMVGIIVGLVGLTKGIIFILPLSVIICYELIKGFVLEKDIKTTIITILKHFSVIILSALAVILPWHLYMVSLHGKSFIDSYIFYHILERASSSIEDKGKPIYWYLIVLKVSMRIWFILLIPSFFFALLAALNKNYLSKIKIYITNKEADGFLFLIIWALVPFVFLSLSISKLIWYVMPIYVPLSILCGASYTFLSRKLFSYNKLRELFFLSPFLLLIFGLGYFYTQKNLVYTSDLNSPQKEILLAANTLYPSYSVWVDRLDYPVILFYRNGPFQVSEFKPIKARLSLLQSNELFVFITNQRRFRELQLVYPTLKIDAVSGDFVLASYIYK